VQRVYEFVRTVDRWPTSLDGPNLSLDVPQSDVWQAAYQRTVRFLGADGEFVSTPDSYAPISYAGPAGRGFPV
jgi:hypothetical protein